jgi:hypothetical protein
MLQIAKLLFCILIVGKQIKNKHPKTLNYSAKIIKSFFSKFWPTHCARGNWGHYYGNALLCQGKNYFVQLDVLSNPEIFCLGFWMRGTN